MLTCQKISLILVVLISCVASLKELIEDAAGERCSVRTLQHPGGAGGEVALMSKSSVTVT